MRAQISQVATFTADPFGGNPVHVLTLDRARPVEALQRVASQLREPLMAVLVAEGGEVDLRFVTPDGPHAGAGHATHGAAWIAFDRLFPGRTDISFRLADGSRRRARVEDGRVAVDWPAMPGTPNDEVDALEACLGARPRETQIAPFGVVAVFDDEETVRRLVPDQQRIRGLEPNAVVATAPGRSADFTIRVFAPKNDLPEDPVCGTAHRILAPLWAPRLGRTDLVSHQLSPRGGELFCRLDGDRVVIAGRAVPFLDGTVEVDG